MGLLPQRKARFLSILSRRPRSPQLTHDKTLSTTRISSTRASVVERGASERLIQRTEDTPARDQRRCPRFQGGDEGEISLRFSWAVGQARRCGRPSAIHSRRIYFIDSLDSCDRIQSSSTFATFFLLRLDCNHVSET